MKRFLIIGATSAIAIATARLWLKQNKQSEFFLVARNEEKLTQTKMDLETRGSPKVITYTMDVNNMAQHEIMLEQCVNSLKQIDIVLIAHGTLPDQPLCEQNVDVTLKEFETNGLSVIVLLTLLANLMEQQHFGQIAVISSVAADRGRPSNYLYGAAKAAVTTFCEGLRARLYKHQVGLTIIKPGFVDTPMTQGLPLPKLMVVRPEKIANYIVKGVKANKSVIYAPWFWFFIMYIIRHIPQWLFKRMKL